MISTRFLFVLLSLFIFCGACGIREGMIQKEAGSYLLFTGNTQDAVVYIDDLEPIVLKKWIMEEDDEEKEKRKIVGEVYYQISSGKHSVVVTRSGEEVVNRKMLLGNGITKEIRIP